MPSGAAGHGENVGQLAHHRVSSCDAPHPPAATVQVDVQRLRGLSGQIEPHRHAARRDEILHLVHRGDLTNPAVERHDSRITLSTQLRDADVAHRDRIRGRLREQRGDLGQGLGHHRLP
jgi:hypothetical protein